VVGDGWVYVYVYRKIHVLVEVMFLVPLSCDEATFSQLPTYQYFIPYERIDMNVDVLQNY